MKAGAGYVKAEKAGSKAVFIMRDLMFAIKEDDVGYFNFTEEPASTSATSGCNLFSETMNFPPLAGTSSKGRSPTRSSSSKIKTVAPREGISPFRSRESASNVLGRAGTFCGLCWPQAVKELWYRYDVSLF